MPGAAACVNDSPVPIRRRSTGPLQLPGYRHRNLIKVAPFEKRCAVPQLLGTITASRRAAPHIPEQIDIAVARDVEAMAVAAGERAGRSPQLKPTNRAVQQPIAETKCERRHDAAPPTRRTGSVSYR